MAASFIIKKFSFITTISIERKKRLHVSEKAKRKVITHFFFNKTGVPFPSNNPPGYCPKLVVMCSICSQRSCLQKVTNVYFSFVLKVEKLLLLDKV